ncbi:hypothetical protein AYI68_g7979 [Smittium mucronatum]|uniref:Uncharacterized protein n=1 Tax=Smittium mucronatum TaxID=133383 RepID=A0A1R0GM83_9FUNG|nr:hypothetical protein AYI68_g7979 [Smittium mucronatum]
MSKAGENLKTSSIQHRDTATEPELRPKTTFLKVIPINKSLFTQNKEMRSRKLQNLPERDPDILGTPSGELDYLKYNLSCFKKTIKKKTTLEEKMKKTERIKNIK